MNLVNNAFTIDVEDYFHVQSFADHIDQTTWEKLPCRVERTTRELLDLLEEKNVQGTFFTLGWVAKRFPDLIREVANQGHEIACHGMNHQLVYTQTPDEFARETEQSRKILEDLAQRKIRGYRAATYSITKNSLWALDILLEQGFEYDSSIFPIRHDRYGIPDAQLTPSVITTPRGNPIPEFPISVVPTPIGKLPVAGGGYLRLLPMALTLAGLRYLERKKQPFVIYTHPWEIDPEQPRIQGINAITRLRHYRNLHDNRFRLSNILDRFRFTTMENVMADLGLLPPAV